MENVEPDLTEVKEIKCKRWRCKSVDLLLGRIVLDGQAIEIGNCLIYHVVRFSCSNCHKVYRFQPKPIKGEIEDIEEEV